MYLRYSQKFHKIHGKTPAMSSLVDVLLLTSHISQNIYFTERLQMTERSSHQRCSMRKGVLRNFAKFTGKHLCHSLFLNKVAGMRLASL